MRDVWEISYLNSMSSERLGYPTQKPVELLDRIIEASCPEEGVVLDPFCGCGTALEAAEKLKRKWIGIDISIFASQVVRHRLERRCELSPDDITEKGTPSDIASAVDLARSAPFEFEKWACGKIGAEGLYKNPGDKGSDGGIDGVIPFGVNGGRKYAIVQVKGGRVSVDSVKALYATVSEEPEAAAGILVCFDKYRATADRHRSKKHYMGGFPVIQVLSVEEMLEGKFPNLPIASTRWGRTKQRQTRMDV